MVVELGLQNLSEEEQDTVLDGVSEMIFAKMLIKIFEIVPEDKHEKIKKLMEAGEDGAIQGLIEKYIPDAAHVMQEVIFNAIEEYKAAVRAQA
jgi:hypothetical protein